MPDRIIKESICMSDTLNMLSDFEERFWHRLTVNCDDFGRFDARPAILKGRLFPLMDGKTQKDMTNALNKLASVGLVELYEVDERPFLRVVTWNKHQRVRAKRSKFPAPEDGCTHLPTNDGKCPRNPIQYNPNPNPNPKEASPADVFAEFADGYEPLIKALHGFEAMRNKLKKPLTDNAKVRLIARLKSLSADRDTWVAILNQSEYKCWTDVYELKEGNDVRAGHGEAGGSKWNLKSAFDE